MPLTSAPGAINGSGNEQAIRVAAVVSVDAAVGGQVDRAGENRHLRAAHGTVGKDGRLHVRADLAPEEICEPPIVLSTKVIAHGHGTGIRTGICPDHEEAAIADRDRARPRVSRIGVRADQPGRGVADVHAAAEGVIGIGEIEVVAVRPA